MERGGRERLVCVETVTGLSLSSRGPGLLAVGGYPELCSTLGIPRPWGSLAGTGLWDRVALLGLWLPCVVGRLEGAGIICSTWPGCVGEHQRLVCAPPSDPAATWDPLQRLKACFNAPLCPEP